MRIPPLHVVTDDAVIGDPHFQEHATEVLEAGGADVALHLRAPLASGLRLYELAAQLAPAARSAGALLLVNERVDVALASGADGVQLGARGIVASDARSLLGAERVIGVSVHGEAEAEEAVRGGADFLLGGTLYQTPSHPARPGVGPGFLRELAPYGLPCIGIGGITPKRVREVRAAGAAGVAVLRGVWMEENPATSAGVYLREWKEAK